MGEILLAWNTWTVIRLFCFQGNRGTKYQLTGPPPPQGILITWSASVMPPTTSIITAAAPAHATCSMPQNPQPTSAKPWGHCTANLCSAPPYLFHNTQMTRCERP